MKRVTAPACFLSLLAIGLFAACTNTHRASETAKNPRPNVASVEAVSTTPPSDKVSISGHVVNCHNGNDVRVLHAEPRGTGCQMIYTKAGKKSVVANATTGTEHCENVMDKIRAKLESSNFVCQ